MDLSEYYVLYHQEVETQLTKLERLSAQLKDAADDRALLASALRAAHSIKGATWTIRETPLLLNSEPPDTCYDPVAKLAEQLEAHLENVLDGKHPLDYTLMQDWLNLLEAAILPLRRQIRFAILRKGKPMAPILIVDDDELFRKLMITYFRRLGLEADGVANGHEALTLLQTESSDLQLIILDIAMPGLNGYEFARLVRENPTWNHLPIVAITARKGPDITAEAKAVGINDMITKPPEPDRLLALCTEFGLLPDDK